MIDLSLMTTSELVEDRRKLENVRQDRHNAGDMIGERRFAELIHAIDVELESRGRLAVQ